MSIMVIFGNDEYLVSRKAKEVMDSFLPRDQQMTGLETIDGAVDTIDSALSATGKCEQAVLTTGLFSSRKIVWFKSVAFLSDTRTGRNEQVKERVNAFAAMLKKGISEDHLLVVTAPKIDKRYAFYKACASMGEVVEFNAPDRAHVSDAHAREFAAGEFRKSGARIDEKALALFLEKTGTDTRQIVTEIEKLLLYTAGKPVLESDVEEITSSTRGVPAWDLADAAGNRDLRRALKVLRRLLFQKESPVRLIIGLESRFKDLVLYREAIDRGWLCETGSGRGANYQWQKVPDEIESFFTEVLYRDPRSIHWFRTSILAGQAMNFSAVQIGKCLSAIIETHKRLVSGGASQEVLLETLLVKLLSRAG